jgi:23S rRNA G2445 N2-methylase RlmL
MKFIAYCTKGLEEVAVFEINQMIPDVKNIITSDKRVMFESSLPLRKLVRLRTIDDIGIVIGEVSQVDDIEQIIFQQEKKNLFEAKDLISKHRRLDNTFSITTSIAKSKISAAEIEERVKEHIQNITQMEFTKGSHRNFDIRIFIDGADCVLSLRINQGSLHNRSYKYYSREGALKSSVAAAMVLLASQHMNGKKLVDNFCGSGTILCEAYHQAFDVYGGDIDAEAVDMTRRNLYNLLFRKEEQVKQLDAKKTKWPTHVFDAAVSNLPWDKQIKVGSITDLYIGTLKEYKRIMKENGVAVLLVSKPELLIKHAKLIFPNSTITKYPIGILGQNPTIVLIDLTNI